MSPEAASAAREVARSQYEVPAQQETKQEEERTKQREIGKEEALALADKHCALAREESRRGNIRFWGALVIAALLIAAVLYVLATKTINEHMAGVLIALIAVPGVVVGGVWGGKALMATYFDKKKELESAAREQRKPGRGGRVV